MHVLSRDLPFSWPSPARRKPPFRSAPWPSRTPRSGLLRHRTGAVWIARAFPDAIDDKNRACSPTRPTPKREKSRAFSCWGKCVQNHVARFQVHSPVLDAVPNIGRVPLPVCPVHPREKWLARLFTKARIFFGWFKMDKSRENPKFGVPYDTHRIDFLAWFGKEKETTQHRKALPVATNTIANRDLRLHYMPTASMETKFGGALTLVCNSISG